MERDWIRDGFLRRTGVFGGGTVGISYNTRLGSGSQIQRETREFVIRSKHQKVFLSYRDHFGRFLCSCYLAGPQALKACCFVSGVAQERNWRSVIDYAIRNLANKLASSALFV